MKSDCQTSLPPRPGSPTPSTGSGATSASTTASTTFSIPSCASEDELRDLRQPPKTDQDDKEWDRKYADAVSRVLVTKWDCSIHAVITRTEKKSEKTEEDLEADAKALLMQNFSSNLSVGAGLNKDKKKACESTESVQTMGGHNIGIFILKHDESQRKEHHTNVAAHVSKALSARAEAEGCDASEFHVTIFVVIRPKGMILPVEIDEKETGISLAEGTRVCTLYQSQLSDPTGPYAPARLVEKMKAGAMRHPVAEMLEIAYRTKAVLLDVHFDMVQGGFLPIDSYPGLQQDQKWKSVKNTIQLAGKVRAMQEKVSELESRIRQIGDEQTGQQLDIERNARDGEHNAKLLDQIKTQLEASRQELSKSESSLRNSLELISMQVEGLENFQAYSMGKHAEHDRRLWGHDGKLKEHDGRLAAHSEFFWLMSLVIVALAVYLGFIVWKLEHKVEAVHMQNIKVVILNAQNGWCKWNPFGECPVPGDGAAIKS